MTYTAPGTVPAAFLFHLIFSTSDALSCYLDICVANSLHANKPEAVKGDPFAIEHTQQHTRTMTVSDFLPIDSLLKSHA